MYQLTPCLFITFIYFRLICLLDSFQLSCHVEIFVFIPKKKKVIIIIITVLIIGGVTVVTVLEVRSHFNLQSF